MRSYSDALFKDQQAQMNNDERIVGLVIYTGILLINFEQYNYQSIKQIYNFPKTKTLNKFLLV